MCVWRWHPAALLLCLRRRLVRLLRRCLVLVLALLNPQRQPGLGTSLSGAFGAFGAFIAAFTSSLKRISRPICRPKAKESS